MKPTNKQPHSPLVAIDFGTHELRAIAAEQVAEGMPLHILGMEVEPIKPNKLYKTKGTIHQTTNAGAILSETLKKLANRIGYKGNLKQVFVSLNSQKMQVVTVSAKRDYARREKLTQKHINELENECREKVYKQDNTLTVISLRQQQVFIDGVLTDENPLAQSARKLEIHYLAMVVLKEVEDSFHSAFQHAIQVDIENEWISPEPLSWAITTDEDSAKGCAILDLGAQLTTLTFYKEGFVTKTKASPLGSDLLTIDLQEYTAKKITLQQAELLKQKFAFASPALLKTNRTIAISTTDNTPLHITEAEIANVTEARLEEILQPLLAKLNEWEQPCCIYLTGGGAMLNGICQYVQKLTGIPTEIATHADWLENTAQDICYEPRFTTLIGTLLMAADHQREHPESKPLVKAPFQKISEYFKKRTENIGDLFAE